MIKRIAVMQRQIKQLLQVGWLNGEEVESLSLKGMDDLRDVSLKFPDSDLHHEFPEGNNAHKDVVGRIFDYLARTGAKTRIVTEPPQYCMSVE